MQRAGTTNIEPSSRNGQILDERRLRPRGSVAVNELPEETLIERGLALVRHRWWVILQALIVIPAVALGLSLVQDEAWTATSTLVFQAPRQSSGAVDLPRQATTQGDLVSLPVVAERTAADLGRGWTATAVRDAVEVSPSSDSNLVDINATAPSASGAVTLADAYAAAFVSLRDAASLGDTQRRLKVFDDYFRSLPLDERSGPRGQRLQQRLDQLRINESLQANDQVGAAEVVQRATLPGSPSSPKTIRNVVLAVLLAGVIGIALAALLERLDRAVKTVDELERIYGLPVLARIPRARGLGKRLRRSGAGEVLRQGPEAEAFRALRASLRYFNVDGNLRSLLIVSPEAEDGKSTISACLATSFAQRGDRVVLVETDLHKGHSAAGRGGASPSEVVGLEDPNTVGLSGVLAGADLDEALRTVMLWSGDGDARQLTVLPAGPVPPNPSALLESRRMRDVMAELAGRYDIVIYDSPAMSAVSDALALVPHMGGVIVVSRLNYTSRDRARDLLKQLGMLQAQVLGVVANYADSGKKRGYDYYQN
jgi:succinoglycan biosynthesis transport protein ExoP